MALQFVFTNLPYTLLLVPQYGFQGVQLGLMLVERLLRLNGWRVQRIGSVDVARHTGNECYLEKISSRLI